MKTEADEHRDAAVESVQSAITRLGRIIIDCCPGHDDYKPAYRDLLAECLTDLILIRNRLK